MVFSEVSNMATSKKKKKKVALKTSEEIHQLRSKEDRIAAITGWVGEINKNLKKAKQSGRVDIGADIKHMDPPRFQTGILGLDIALAGGLPRGGPVQHYGEFSCGKTTTCLKMLAHTQREYAATCAWTAIEGFDQPYARRLGVQIPYSGKELEKLADKEGVTIATEMEKKQKTWPPFVLLQHNYGDAALEMTYQALKSGLYDIQVVDSLGAVRSYGDTEERSVEDQKYGGNSNLFARFAGKAHSAFNTKYDPETGAETAEEGWVPNLTSLNVINQARVVIGGYNPSGRKRFHAPGGEALKHFWSADIYYSKGERYFRDAGSKKKIYYAMSIRADCRKSKVGPPFRTADWDYYFEDHEKHKFGSIDTAEEVVTWGIFYGFIEQSGSSYQLNGDKIRGREKVVKYLNKNPQTLKELYQMCVTASKG